MTDPTPTTEEVRTPKTFTVRACFVKGHSFPLTTEVEERYEEFDRWLDEHDREVAQNAVNRFYNLLVLKGEYRDIYGLAYIGDLVNKEFRGEVTVVVEGAQIYGEPV